MAVRGWHRHVRRGSLVVVAAAAASLAPAASAGAVRPAGCVAQATATQPAPAACGAAGGVLRPLGLSLSPDGAWLDVAGTTSGAVATFARDTTSGALRQVGCVSDNGTDGVDGTGGSCPDVHALRGASAVAASPDGRHVYVTAARSGSVGAFARRSDGTLEQLQCIKDSALESVCDDGRALGGARDVVVSPDGRHLYVAAGGPGAVASFARDALTGRLRQTGCTSVTGNDGACADGAALAGATALAVSSDGRAVHVAAARGGGALATFARDPGSGLLEQTGCLSAAAPRERAACSRARLLRGAAAVAATGSGAAVAGAGASAVSLLDGGMRRLACLRLAGGAPCRRAPVVEDVRALAALPGGDVLAGGADAVARIDHRTAAVTACAGVRRRRRECTDAARLRDVRDLAVSSDGRHAYAALARNTVMVLVLERGAGS